MAVPAPKKTFSVHEYLTLEEAAEERHEYDNGEILAMSGGSFAHSQICVNIAGEVRTRLKGKPRQALESNMKVRLTEAGKYVYPDLTVLCGSPEFDLDDPKRHVIVNPAVIVEVLSPSTEGYDRGEKFEAYRTLLSLKEYVLVSQTEPKVESFVRHADGRWSIHVFSGMEAIAKLESVGIDIPLREVYLNVDFQPVSSPVEEP